MPQAKMPRTYTAKQMSEILQMPVREVYRSSLAGLIPGRFQVGGRTRWNADAIDRWLNVEGRAA